MTSYHLLPDTIETVSYLLWKRIKRAVLLLSCVQNPKKEKIFFLARLGKDKVDQGSSDLKHKYCRKFESLHWKDKRNYP